MNEQTNEPTNGQARRRFADGDGRGRAPLARALPLAESLEALLIEERRAAAVAEPLALVALATRKRHLLDALESLQPALDAAIERLPPADEERRALLERLELCQAVNRENGVAVGAAAHHVRSALAMLRSTLSLEDLTLYDEHGELLTRREQRRFGRA